jgi:hypothetical protein
MEVGTIEHIQMCRTGRQTAQGTLWNGGKADQRPEDGKDQARARARYCVERPQCIVYFMMYHDQIQAEAFFSWRIRFSSPLFRQWREKSDAST